MRSYFLALALPAMLCCSAANAQNSKDTARGPYITYNPPKTEYGVKLGLNMQSLSGAAWDNTYNPGIVAGVYGRMNNKKVGVRGELLLSTSHYTTLANIVDSPVAYIGDFIVTRLNIPVLFECKLYRDLWLNIGPQYSRMFTVNSLNDYAGDAQLFFNPGEFSVIGGLDTRLAKNLSAGLRYTYGLSDIRNPDLTTGTDKWQNSTINFYLSYQLSK